MANRFLNSNSSNLNLSNGTVDIYALNLGSSSLSSSMPVKTNSTRQLVSTKLAISDTTGLQTSLDSKALKIGTEVIQAGGFKIAGGTNTQYLTADGGFGYPSGGGSSNIYLYSSSTNTTMAPTNNQIRYNNTDQKLATQIAVSHLTRDIIDIDSFLSLVTQTTIVYIQEQGSSVNWIKYVVNGAITVIPNNYYVFTVVYQGSEGRGDSGFSNLQDITLSFFTNDINNNTRLNTLETKTRYQTSPTTNQTDFAGDLLVSGGVKKSGTFGFFKNDGSVDTTTYLPLGGGSMVGDIDMATQRLLNCDTILVNSATTLNHGYSNVINYSSSSSSAIGSQNTINNDHQIIVGNNNTCSSSYSIAIGNNITNSTANSCCIGNNAITQIYPNSLVCDLGNTTTRFKDIFISGGVKRTSGSSTEFFKTDGSIDSNTYITSSSLNPYLLKSGGTMTGDIFMNNNYITGCKTIGFNGNNVAVGNGAGISALLAVNVGNGAGGLSQGVQSVAIGYASGASSQGVQCVAVGPSAGQLSQADYSVAVGYSAGFSGQLDNSVAVGVEAGRTGQANNCVAIGRQAGNVSQGSCSIAIGAFAGVTSQSPSSIILNASGSTLNSSTTGLFIKPIRNDTSSNTILYNSSTGELTYIPTPPVFNITNSATLFYNGATLTSSNTGFIPIASMTVVGGLPTQVAQGTTTHKDKIFKTLFPESSVASFQDSGLLGNTNFLLNSQSLYVGMGWNIKISFGIADTNGNGINPSPAGMFVGLVSQNTIGWTALINPATILSCIGVGHNYGESLIYIYHKGSVSGTINSTIWGTATPDNTRWFHLSMTNLFNSNDVIVVLTETISNVSETRTFTCGTGTSALATNIRLYPCIQRIIGNTASTGSGRIHFGQFTYNQLI